MIRYIAFGFAILVGLNVFGQTSSSILPPAQISGYSLAFSDDFNSLDLSPNGSGAYTWYESVWWDTRIPDRSQVSVGGSILSLSWQRGQSSANTSITTFAHDKSQGRTWRYGYFEARMRWDVVKGSWPAFWLIASQDATGQNIQDGVKDTGEIDIFEGQGAYPTIFYGTVNEWINDQHANRNNPNWYALPAAISSSEFHTYGLLWVPGKLTWYLDNQPLFSAPTPAVVDAEDFFVVLGSQEGVNWQPGSLNDVTAQKITLDVDWVRVWQH